MLCFSRILRRQAIEVKITCKGATELRRSSLIPFQGNLKSLSKQNYEKLKKEILELGYSEPVSIWQSDNKNYILNGHQRIRTLGQMVQEGVTVPDSIPCNIIYANSYKEAKKKVLALTSQYGEMEKDGLYEFLEQSEIEFAEIKDDMRFPEIDLDDFAKEFYEEENQGNTDEDEVPEEVEAVCKTGDLWQLGEHRLLCGDATSKEDVDKLVDGQKIDMVFTDPPYNQSQSGGGMADKRPGWSKHKALSDFDPELFLQVLALLNIPTIYIFCSKDLLKSYFQWIEEFKRKWNLLVMRKQNPIPMKNNTFLADVEWLIFTRSQGAKFNNNLQYDYYRRVFDTQVKASEFGHPTEKRVEVPQRFIEISSDYYDNVLDLFGGSGSTLIACEKTNRKCFMMEIDPHYCDVIIKRWEDYTGHKAKKFEI